MKELLGRIKGARQTITLAARKSLESFGLTKLKALVRFSVSFRALTRRKKLTMSSIIATKHLPQSTVAFTQRQGHSSSSPVIRSSQVSSCIIISHLIYLLQTLRPFIPNLRIHHLSQFQIKNASTNTTSASNTSNQRASYVMLFDKDPSLHPEEGYLFVDMLQTNDPNSRVVMLVRSATTGKLYARKSVTAEDDKKTQSVGRGSRYHPRLD